MFAPISDPSACVLVQQWSESPLIVNPRKVWVAVQTVRVDKIKFISGSATGGNYEQIPNNHPRRS
jgi:hypothetical protein